MVVFRIGRFYCIFPFIFCLHRKYFIFYFSHKSFGSNNAGLINNATTNMTMMGMDNFELQFIRVLNKVYTAIERNELRLADQDRKDAIKLEWQQLALIIDRFLLWIFIISTVGATFGILYMSPHTKLFTM